jgi:hypothetical protein
MNWYKNLYIYNLSLMCLLINFFVKIGIIYGFKCKQVLVIGCILDLIGVWLVARKTQRR